MQLVMHYSPERPDPRILKKLKKLGHSRPAGGTLELDQQYTSAARIALVIF
jgi:hypothetical protein